MDESQIAEMLEILKGLVKSVDEMTAQLTKLNQEGIRYNPYGHMGGAVSSSPFHVTVNCPHHHPGGGSWNGAGTYNYGGGGWAAGSGGVCVILNTDGTVTNMGVPPAFDPT